MLQEMRVRNYSPNTITTYISLLAALARHFNKSPDLISSDELKDYLFKKISQDQLSPSAINQIISAFRILQVDVLGKDWDPIKVKRPKMPKTLPLVFSKEEISEILACLKNRKHYCLVALTYAAGLRLNEVVNLKPADLDSSRMQIRISSGKGNKAPGSLSVLHTWGQALTYHPHIHMLVPAGGLDPDHTQWIHAPASSLSQSKHWLPSTEGFSSRVLPNFWVKTAFVFLMTKPTSTRILISLKRHSMPKTGTCTSKKPSGVQRRSSAIWDDIPTA
jgi:hypothetical protein